MPQDQHVVVVAASPSCMSSVSGAAAPHLRARRRAGALAAQAARLALSVQAPRQSVPIAAARQQRRGCVGAGQQHHKRVTGVWPCNACLGRRRSVSSGRRPIILGFPRRVVTHLCSSAFSTGRSSEQQRPKLPHAPQGDYTEIIPPFSSASCSRFFTVQNLGFMKDPAHRARTARPTSRRAARRACPAR